MQKSPIFGSEEFLREKFNFSTAWLYAIMNKIDKTLTSISLLWALIFIVVTHLEVQAGLQGQDGFMTLEQYNIFWWVSLPLVLFGAVLCLKDVHQRFSDKGERSKWYVLFIFIGSLSYPYFCQDTHNKRLWSKIKPIADYIFKLITPFSTPVRHVP